jgi:hypothetical protein
MTVSRFAQAVHSDLVRWVLFNGKPRVVPGHRVGAAHVLKAVAATCRRIPRSAFVRGRRPAAHGALYDCRGHSRALELYAHGVKPQVSHTGRR